MEEKNLEQLEQELDGKLAEASEEPTIEPIQVPEGEVNAEQEVEEATDEAEEVEEEVEDEPDVSGMMQSLADTIKGLQQEIQSMKNSRGNFDSEEEQEKEPNFDIPDDNTELINQFAKNPKDVMGKIVNKAVYPYQQAIKRLEQDAAIDFVTNQKDFKDGEYKIDDVFNVVTGAHKNDWFQYGKTRVQLKDLPPRQKAEAALWIIREQKKQQPAPAPKRPKPVTTVKTKKVARQPAKKETEMSAAEFLKIHGLDKRVGEL